MLKSEFPNGPSERRIRCRESLRIQTLGFQERRIPPSSNVCAASRRDRPGVLAVIVPPNGSALTLEMSAVFLAFLFPTISNPMPVFGNCTMVSFDPNLWPLSVPKAVRSRLRAGPTLEGRSSLPRRVPGRRRSPPAGPPITKIDQNWQMLATVCNILQPVLIQPKTSRMLPNCFRTFVT